MTINVAQAQKLLGTFDFQKLFIETFGWNYPRGVAEITWQAGAAAATCVPIATLAGVVVFEVTTADGEIPDWEAMKAIDSVVAKQRHEHLLIFLDGQRTRSLWYWVKRDGAKTSHAVMPT